MPRCLRLSLAVAASISMTAVYGVARAASVNADADAHIRAGEEADSNFGDAITMYTRWANATNSVSAKIYIRFDLSAVTPDATASHMDAATLRLRDNQFAEGQRVTVRVFGLRDGHDGERWAEKNDPNAITWSNAPANDPAGSGFVAEEVVELGELSYTTSGTAAWIEWSSPALVEFLNRDSNSVVTLMLQSNANATAQFAQRERDDIAGGPPQLRLEPSQ